MNKSISKRTQSSTQTKKSYSKHNIIPPTCSTFNNYGTIRNKVCNMAGFLDEKYFSNAHKKPFALFGLPKGHRTNENIRNLCMTQQPFHTNEKVYLKEPLPQVDLVITNLKSNTNFIKLNTKTAKIPPSKNKKEENNYLKKKDYGNVPSYLNKIKEKINQEEELIQKQVEDKNKQSDNKIILNQEQIIEIRNKLEQKHKELTFQYQKITHISKKRVFRVTIRSSRKGLKVNVQRNYNC